MNNEKHNQKYNVMYNCELPMHDWEQDPEGQSYIGELFVYRPPPRSIRHGISYTWKDHAPVMVLRKFCYTYRKNDEGECETRYYGYVVLANDKNGNPFETRISQNDLNTFFRLVE